MLRALSWQRTGKGIFRLSACAYVVFGVADCVTTAVALTRGGHERNPFAAALYQQYGLASLFALKGLVVAVILFVLTRLPQRVAVWVTISFAVSAALVVVANLQALRG